MDIRRTTTIDLTPQEVEEALRHWLNATQSASIPESEEISVRHLDGEINGESIFVCKTMVVFNSTDQQ